MPGRRYKGESARALREKLVWRMGSSVSLPAVGLRSGLMLLTNSGGAAVTFGLLARWTRSESVSDYSGACVALVVCGTSARKATYGGSMYGAYLTVTGLRLLGS